MLTRNRIRMIVPAMAAAFGLATQSAQAEGLLEWQRAGYVTEVVVVTTPRADFGTVAGTDAGYVEAAAQSLAWQEPGYVTETVIVTASRDDYLEAIRTLARDAAADADTAARPSPVLGTPNR